MPEHEICPENVYIENGVETIGEHDWQPYEARVQLNSRTYAFQGYVFKLRCSYCGLTRKALDTEGKWALPW